MPRHPGIIGGSGLRGAAWVCLLLAAGLTACVDGGWGEGLGDVTIGQVPTDGGAGDALPADTGGTDSLPDQGLVDAPRIDPDAVYACGEGPGNEVGVGKPCTQGGGECPGELSCDIDLDPQGIGACILLLCPDDATCGSGASCCTPTGSPMPVCIIDECLPPECGGTPADVVSPGDTVESPDGPGDGDPHGPDSIDATD
ncbi:MAG: hypothetical protein FJ098_09895 [Deltaproteobacteria bacterium]|nr:hypothetical protein [Deltaproteobacteria bacterium]